MNSTIFLAFAIFFLAYYCQGMENGEKNLFKQLEEGIKKIEEELMKIKEELKKMKDGKMKKEVELKFEVTGQIEVQAFRDKDNQLLYTGKTKGYNWQSVKMAVSGDEWNGLRDNEKITFKDGEGKVLGSATAQVLLKTSQNWLAFKERTDYYYWFGVIYFKNANGNKTLWSAANLIK
ncbi:hypothetical protein niasHS_009540 [Heterodera schachtii]|uniref:Uncharacterized protein n=1 Tax=Heterodera schachtii TaxID=97005 RepID=A0ABD2JEI7_HETSC